MKPTPAPNVPGRTEFERFDNAVRMVFALPKEAIQKENARLKRRTKKKRKKKAA